jgi:hypothetical protein
MVVERLFDDALIQASCDGFFGYGSATAPVWFVGKEEGGGGSFDEIRKRLAVWDRRGRLLLEHVSEVDPDRATAGAVF